MNHGSVTEGCLRVLEHLTDAPNGLPLGQVCDDLSLPKSVGHRFLSLLIQCGYVSQDEVTRQYRLTLRLPVLGFRYLAATGVHDVCQPLLDALARETGEYVALGVMEGDNLVWVANAHGSRAALRYVPAGGPRIRPNATASGIVWLASLPEDEAVRIALDRGLDTPRGYGLNAAHSVAELMQRRQQAAADGYAISLEWGEPGINAVAVAIPPASKTPALGTLSVAGPASRVTAEAMRAALPALRETAGQLASIWPLRPRSQPLAVLEDSLGAVGPRSTADRQVSE